MEVMTWSLEAMRYWMDQNRLKLNPSKIQLLFVDDRSGLVPVLSLAQDWVVFLWRSRSVSGSGILLDSQFLLKMAVETVAAREYALADAPDCRTPHFFFYITQQSWHVQPTVHMQLPLKMTGNYSWIKMQSPGFQWTGGDLAALCLLWSMFP